MKKLQLLFAYALTWAGSYFGTALLQNAIYPVLTFRFRWLPELWAGGGFFPFVITSLVMGLVFGLLHFSILLGLERYFAHSASRRAFPSLAVGLLVGVLASLGNVLITTVMTGNEFKALTISGALNWFVPFLVCGFVIGRLWRNFRENASQKVPEK